MQYLLHPVGPGSSHTANITKLLFILYRPCVSGHDRYYNKYINVKKGGIGGIAMLLAGYVAMSYMWEYDHISKTLTHLLCFSPLVAFKHA